MNEIILERHPITSSALISGFEHVVKMPFGRIIDIVKYEYNICAVVLADYSRPYCDRTFMAVSPGSGVPDSYIHSVAFRIQISNIYEDFFIFEKS